MDVESGIMKSASIFHPMYGLTLVISGYGIFVYIDLAC